MIACVQWLKVMTTWNVTPLLRIAYTDQAHVSCRSLMAHLGKLNPKWGTAGQAFKHDQKGTQEVALRDQLHYNMSAREVNRLQKNA